MRVMGARVLVRRLQETLPTGTLIVGVELDERLSPFAEIVAVGTLRTRSGDKLPLDVGPGQRVYLKQHCGVPVQINGETLYFVENDDVLAVVS